MGGEKDQKTDFQSCCSIPIQQHLLSFFFFDIQTIIQRCEVNDLHEKNDDDHQ